MAVSKANQRAVNKYKKNNYDRIEITVPKGQRGVFQAHASARGESVNAFIGRAIQEAIERDIGSPQDDTGGLSAEAIKIAQEISEAVGERTAKDITTVQPIPHGTLKIVESAAKAAGEKPGDFISRAVATQAKRDEVERNLKGGKPNE